MEHSEDKLLMPVIGRNCTPTLLISCCSIKMQEFNGLLGCRIFSFLIFSQVPSLANLCLITQMREFRGATNQAMQREDGLVRYVAISRGYGVAAARSDAERSMTCCS
jgi:hypothetical protein